MLFGFILLLFLIGITFRNHTQKVKNPKNTSWTIKQRIIVAFFFAISPFILVNLIAPKIRHYSPQEVVDNRKDFSETTYQHAIDQLLLEHPNSIDLHIKDIDLFMRKENADCELLTRTTFSYTFEINKILHEYAMMRCGEQMSYSYGKYIGLDTIGQNYRGIHFVKAKGNLAIGNPIEAIKELKLEINQHPDFEEAYYPLGELMIEIEPDVYYEQLKDNDFRNKLPARQWLNFYFDNGHYLDYLWGTIYYRVTSITPLAFIASLLISFVWLFFIRSLDFFRKEKWIDLITVFLLGALFSFLCLLFYAFAERVLRFDINGDLLNDFLYSVFVIGGSEELVKFLPWIIFGALFKRFKEPYDYILFASVSALGFAFAENWMYLESSGNIVIRCIMTVVSHMFDASIVAYSFILARFKFKKVVWKIVSIISGFALAALSHGFYDVWLISPATENMYLITVLFFIFSLHMWFFFKNNAINQSVFFTYGNNFNREKLQDQITYSIIAVLILEFTFVSIQFGTEFGNEVFGFKAILIAAFVFYISMMLFKMDIRKGIWVRYKIKIPFFGSAISGLFQDTDQNTDLTGTQLRLLSISKNTLLSRQLPVTGRCLKRITVDQRPNWYIFELDSPVFISGFVIDKVILKNRFGHQSLRDENTEIVMLFIPTENLLEKSDFLMSELHYEERVFSEMVL